jgi:subtilisin family serine protease
MKRNGTLVVCLVVIVLSLAVVPLNAHLTDSTIPTSLTDSTDDSTTTDSSISLRDLNQYRHRHPPSVDHEVEVVVEVKNGTTVPTSSEFAIERIYTREGQRFMRGSIPMSEVRSFVENPRLRAVRITSDQPVYDGRVASGVSKIGADRVHNRNSIDENITIGIIDSDFLISHPSIAQSVGAYRVFGNTSNWQHGTAVASVVIDTAPNVELHLASIGPTTTPEEYAAAVEWLQQSGADIILDSGSYYAQPGDGTGKIAQIATNASSEAVFITSVGNHAQRYWAGNYSSDEGWVTIHNGTQANFLNNGKPFGGNVRLTLRWDGWPNTSTDYDLYLLRKQPGRDAVVAKTTGHNGRPFEYLETSVPRGQYYVSIQAENGPKPGQTSHLELFANRELRFRSSGGHAAPANAKGVLAVGASENGTVEPFSVRGADVVAPDSMSLKDVSVDGGTSFSAPYVAGTAALLLSSNPGLTPADVRTLIKTTADDIGPDGVDLRSGYGLVNASRAVAIANETNDDRPAEPTAMSLNGYSAQMALPSSTSQSPS